VALQRARDGERRVFADGALEEVVVDLAQDLLLAPVGQDVEVVYEDGALGDRELGQVVEEDVLDGGPRLHDVGLGQPRAAHLEQARVDGCTEVHWRAVFDAVANKIDRSSALCH
jgi:hypothetical protein